MGPIRSFSGMVDDVREQQASIRRLIERLRSANRKLTGSTGEPPTAINANGGGRESEVPPAMPLLVDLTTAIEQGNPIVEALAQEVAYFEMFSETQQDEANATSAMGTMAKLAR